MMASYTPYTPPVIRVKIPGSNHRKMRETIRLVGEAIQRASTYLPLRNHAAALATLAAPKDYLGQVKRIYDDAIRRWRYVNDPWGSELLTYSPEAIYRLVLGLDGVGVGRGRGAGDCDCISAAMGAELLSIGRPVRIGVTAPPGSPSGRSFSHIFVQAYVPRVGWVTVDPVNHPQRKFGAIAPHSRIAFFGLDGQLQEYSGNVVGLSDDISSDMAGQGQEEKMQTIPDITQWHDYGLGGVDYQPNSMPEDWRNYGLPEWGAYVDTMGYIPGEGLGLAAEVDLDLYGANVGARTPMLELMPRDYKYIQVMKQPYPGMIALGDDGSLYEYDNTMGWGFFKKILKKVKSKVRSVGKRIKGAATKLLKKIPGGKYLMRIGSKVLEIAKKIVKPLVKYVGKYAAKLAPVAALIPGYGPAIAGALYGAGKIAKLMTQYGVKLKGAAGTVRSLTAGSGNAMKKFQAALTKEAAKERMRMMAQKRKVARRVVAKKQALQRAALLRARRA